MINIPGVSPAHCQNKVRRIIELQGVNLFNKYKFVLNTASHYDPLTITLGKAKMETFM